MLMSKLFRGDTKLEAAAISDPAHILPGSSGQHVGKIQRALARLDGAVIELSELQYLRYGPSTASAVLSYKRKRNIINRSYQTQPDDIVGKMTIASLDAEIWAKENISPSLTRMEPWPPYVSTMHGAFTAHPLVSFAVGAPRVTLTSGLLIRAPLLGDLNPKKHKMVLPLGGSQGLRVTNGLDRIIEAVDPTIAEVVNPDDKNQKPVIITHDPQDVLVVGKARGRTDIIARTQSQPSQITGETPVFHGMPNRVITVAFNFLERPWDEATVRNPGDEDGMLSVVNGIYIPQTNISFAKAGVQRFQVDSFRQASSGLEEIILEDGPDPGPDWNKCIAKRDNNAMVNVYFVAVLNTTDLMHTGPERGHTNLFKARADGQRDCMVKDKLEKNTKGEEVSPGEVLAHEFGHCLGVGHEQALNADDLMKAPRLGVNIPSATAVLMHEHLDRFAP